MAGSQSLTMEFPTNARQEEAFEALATFVLTPATSPPLDIRGDDEYRFRLDELLFDVLESLFYLKLVPFSGATCITDVVLMLLWLRNDGSAVKASSATHHCAIFQYWGYTIVIHTIRLRLLGFPKYREHCAQSGGNKVDLSQAEEIETFVLATILCITDHSLILKIAE